MQSIIAEIRKQCPSLPANRVAEWQVTWREYQSERFLWHPVDQYLANGIVNPALAEELDAFSIPPSYFGMLTVDAQTANMMPHASEVTKALDVLAESIMTSEPIPD